MKKKIKIKIQVINAFLICCAVMFLTRNIFAQDYEESILPLQLKVKEEKISLYNGGAEIKYPSVDGDGQQMIKVINDDINGDGIAKVYYESGQLKSEANKEIEKRYEIEFERIGADKNHVHVLCSAAPRYAPSEIVKLIKGITAREIFKEFPKLKKDLWGGEFWSDGKYIGTVGEGGNKAVIERYIERQGSSPIEAQLSFWL